MTMSLTSQRHSNTDCHYATAGPARLAELQASSRYSLTFHLVFREIQIHHTSQQPEGHQCVHLLPQAK